MASVATGTIGTPIVAVPEPVATLSKVDRVARSEGPSLYRGNCRTSKAVLESKIVSGVTKLKLVGKDGAGIGADTMKPLEATASGLEVVGMELSADPGTEGFTLASLKADAVGCNASAEVDDG